MVLRVEKPARSARPAQPVSASPLVPGTVFGKPIPTSMRPPLRLGQLYVGYTLPRHGPSPIVRHITSIPSTQAVEVILPHTGHDHPRRVLQVEAISPLISTPPELIETSAGAKCAKCQRESPCPT